jgi:1-acyl-sn-glycerol-3-phosphate acyltransferase
MRFIKALLIVFHILLGLLLIVVTGALWQPLAPRVKATKRWWLGRILRLMSIETTVFGEPPSQQNGKGLVFVSNHVSWLDIPLIGSLREINFLSKAEVRKWPLIGKLADSTGTLFIQRGSGDTHRVTQDIAERVKQGHSVLFFPEGTTTDGSSVKRFHHKLFRASELTDIAFCPVVIHYDVEGEPFNPVAFIDDDEFAEHLWHLLRYHHIRARVEFLPARAIAPDNLRADVLTLEKEMRSKVEFHDRKIRLENTEPTERPVVASA